MKWVNWIKQKRVSRRDLLKISAVGTLLTGANAWTKMQAQTGSPSAPTFHPGAHSEDVFGVMGKVDYQANGFDPNVILQDFDYGRVSTLENGQTLREYTINAIDKEIEVAPGIFFPAWTYNGRVPGPTIRCTEGDLIRITFNNAGTHPHTIHFHGIHSAAMDGVPGAGDGMIHPNQSTVYEFEAAPFGCHLYHCHAIPLKRHIHKGLYGAFIVDPDPSRYSGEEQQIARTRHHASPENAEFNEMMMIMNGFDTNIDGGNEIYAVNSIGFCYQQDPIPVSKNQKQRLYLINVTEFDAINSFHLHANFFDYYDHGTTLTPTLKTVDTIMQCQGQRGILEFSFEGFEDGMYMFHAHQSEFAELGWMGMFNVS